jgi:hypothetical protein
MGGDLNQQVAATAMHDLHDGQPTRGTLLLCSSPVGRVSMGAPNAERTLFTGAVLDVLYSGSRHHSGYLSFADLRDEAFERMLGSFGANAPRPALYQVNATHGDLTRAPAFLNRSNEWRANDREERRQRQEELARQEEEKERILAEMDAQRRREERRQRHEELAKQEEEKERIQAEMDARREDARGKRQAELEKLTPEQAWPDDGSVYELKTGELICIFTLSRSGLVGLNKLAMYLNSLKDECAIDDWHMHGWLDERAQSKVAIRFSRPLDGMLARARWKDST